METASTLVVVVKFSHNDGACLGDKANVGSCCTRDYSGNPPCVLRQQELRAAKRVHHFKHAMGRCGGDHVAWDYVALGPRQFWSNLQGPFWRASGLCLGAPGG